VVTLGKAEVTDVTVLVTWDTADEAELDPEVAFDVAAVPTVAARAATSAAGRMARCRAGGVDATAGA
jgi:hypothetical protein